MRATISPESNVTSKTYFREIGHTAILNADEEFELAERVRDGDPEARDHLVRANLRLVVHIARTYQRHGVELDDMVAEGNLGLIRAAEAFDSDIGTRFSTYAAYWIKQSINRLILNTAKPIRLPAYMNELMVKWERARKQLEADLKRTPTKEEIAGRLKLKPKKLAIISKAIRIYNASMPTPGGDASKAVEHTLVDDADRPDQVIGNQEDISKVVAMLDRMDPREATVLRLRFGLDDEEPLTLLQVGERLGLTRERVRQIERDALRHLSEKNEN